MMGTAATLLCAVELLFVAKQRIYEVPHGHTFLYSSIHPSMALQPFLGPWPRSQFRNATVGRTPWTGDQAATYTQDSTNRINAHRHPCREWDSYPRSQCSTARPLIGTSLYYQHVCSSCVARQTNAGKGLPLSLFRGLIYRHMLGLLGWGIGQSQGLYTYTGQGSAAVQALVPCLQLSISGNLPNTRQKSLQPQTFRYLPSSFFLIFRVALRRSQ
jgi:hypothetical protein